MLPSPGFGEHNAYVLNDVRKLAQTEIRRPYDEGVVADTPDETLHQ